MQEKVVKYGKQECAGHLGKQSEVFCCLTQVEGKKGKERHISEKTTFVFVSTYRIPLFPKHNNKNHFSPKSFLLLRNNYFLLVSVGLDSDKCESLNCLFTLLWRDSQNVSSQSLGDFRKKRFYAIFQVFYLGNFKNQNILFCVYIKAAESDLRGRGP